MARINPSPIQIEVPQPDSIPDPEVLQKMNDIIKDRSAECKPRKVFFFNITKLDSKCPATNLIDH